MYLGPMGHVRIDVWGSKLLNGMESLEDSLGPLVFYMYVLAFYMYILY